MSAPVPAAHHRARLLAALAEGIRENGYRATTVADIVRRARTSRRTFYEHFTDREDCLRELDSLASRQVALTMRAAIDFDAVWQVRIEQAVDAYLGLAATAPEVTLALHRESAILQHGDGHDGIHEMAVQIVQLFEDTVSEDEPIVPISLPAATMVVAGMREVIVRAFEAGEPLSSVRPLAIAMLCAFVQEGVGAAAAT